MKNLKKINTAILLEDIFQDVIEDEYENGNHYDEETFDHPNIVKYYKEKYLYLTTLKKYNFLKKSWLYKQFDTRGLADQKDKWILLGAEITYKKINIVWWDYNNRELFKDYTISEFKNDIKENIYVIKNLK